MIASQKDGQTWWKIEPKYSTKVLIGNWVEERKRFAKDTGKLGSSTYRTDFICFPNHKPDQTLRRTMMEKLEGLPMQHFFSHHEEPKSRNLVSEYDDKYNRHSYNPILPPLRSWNGRKLAWIPQKSDFPILEPPTNYGLLEHLKKKWHTKEAGVNNSVYTISYESPPISAFATYQLRQPAKTYYLPSSQGHLSQTISRILDLKGVRHICRPLANW
ncbi:cilia- and flagella-associated protein 107 [Grus americana]|uniref:cilia- and flagella-associated protein 107 n=1 Tax=Grus americana TaxID=9117 RepID=UPI00240860B7|nr:cilia- and flagella-associated protein 107 [Grus americana]